MSELEIPRAPRGRTKTCRTWAAEAAKRCLLNNLDPAVAEDRDRLVVYGGTGKAARDRKSLFAILAALESLDHDETLLVQSGKPVAVFRTHPDAPRVLIANSNLVPRWATWEHFRALEAKGLIMFGQMTAGSWIYIGTQGIVQGTFETFASAAGKHFGGDLGGRLIVTAGLGGMGGAQPLAGTMNGATVLVAEVDEARARRRVETRYLDVLETTSLDRAIALVQEARAKKRALSVGWVGNAKDMLEELVRQQIAVDLLTDQTSAHDMLNGYVPAGMTLGAALDLRRKDPKRYEVESRKTVAAHVRAMLALQRAGAVTFDYGNNIRAQAKDAGVEDAFSFPGFVPAYIRPLFCEGKGPFRWVALSGDEKDIARTDELALQTFPQDRSLARWITLAREKVAFQGLPARICWLGYGERAKLGLAINALVAKGEIGPIAIGRDHLDSGSVASPNRETEAMKDGTDAVADWPLLNALLNTASGASWVSLHHGGGVGIGYSIHAGQVIVCDGTPEAARRIERVLTNDPGIGVARHVDAGYDEALACAKARGVKAPLV